MAVIKCLWTLERQSWRQFQIPSSAFFELCFCLYLSGTEKTQKQTIKGKTEQDTNEDEIVGLRLSQCGYLCPHPHGNPFLFCFFFFFCPKYVSGMLVRSGLTENSFFMLLLETEERRAFIRR